MRLVGTPPAVAAVAVAAAADAAAPDFTRTRVQGIQRQCPALSTLQATRGSQIRKRLRNDCRSTARLHAATQSTAAAACWQRIECSGG